MTTDVAVAHEHYNRRGGGEIVAEEIAQTFDAPIYTSFINADALPKTRDIEIYDLFGSGVSGTIIKRNNLASILLRRIYYSFAWEYVEELHNYDIIIQTGNSPSWYVPKDDQIIIKYCQILPRTAYTQFQKKPSGLLRRIYAKISRAHYQQTLSYPDIYIANSDLVARQIQLYWGINTEKLEIIYPPVKLDNYSYQDKADFYLVLNRLVPDKRINEAVDAFSRLPNKKLIIAGEGPERTRLERNAPENVEFKGWVSEEEKQDLLGRAKALIFSSENEEFGIPPVEALASGTPVIGIKDGFTRYQIEDGITGLLYERGAGNLANVVEQFDNHGVEATPKKLRKEAAHYSVENFRERIREVVDKTHQKTV
ncbi:MAG: glycosyltransferase [Candidatus Paceibacteria bacterium]